jgi:hypothetical protein
MSAFKWKADISTILKICSKGWTNDQTREGGQAAQAGAEVAVRKGATCRSLRPLSEENKGRLRSVGHPLGRRPLPVC